MHILLVFLPRTLTFSFPARNRLRQNYISWALKGSHLSPRVYIIYCFDIVSPLATYVLPWEQKFLVICSIFIFTQGCMKVYELHHLTVSEYGAFLFSLCFSEKGCFAFHLDTRLRNTRNTAGFYLIQLRMPQRRQGGMTQV